MPRAILQAVVTCLLGCRRVAAGSSAVALIVCWAMTAFQPVAAAEVQQAVVGRHGDRFHIDLRMRLKIPVGEAWAVLIKFDDLPKLDPIVTFARARPTADASHYDLTTIVHACVLFFCRDIHQFQRIVLIPRGAGGDMDATMVPAHSDFRAGHAHWHLAACIAVRADTCLVFRASMEPDFWVPPWIGTWLLERYLRHQSEVLARGIERRARELYQQQPAAT